MDPTAWLRFTTRTSACLTTTLSLWACLDVETAVCHPLTHETLMHKWVGRWARTVVRLLNVELDASGLHVGTGNAYPGRGANERGRVFVLNHRSAIDIFLTFACTESYLVSRHDLASWPLVGSGAHRLGTLFVDRNSPRSGASVLKQMTRKLQQGSGVAIFPEGTAFAGDEVRPFRPGAFRAAQRIGAEIIPVGIAYADEAAYYGDESFGAHVQRVASLPRLKAAMVFGAPIEPGQGKLTELRDHTREVVQQLVHDARARL